MKYNYETCHTVALTFSTKQDFRDGANGEFQWLRRNDSLQKACAHMAPMRRTLTDDDIAAIANGFDHRRAFKLGDQSAYNAATKRGILDSVCAHMETDRYRILTNEQIAAIASTYKSRSEMKFADNGAYQTATKRGILDAVCDHMDSRGCRRLSDDEVLEVATKFRTRNDFKLGDFGAYTTAIRRGLIDEACDHMEFGATGFRHDKPAVLYQFRIELEDGMVVYKVGITNRKPRQRAITMGIRRGLKADLTHSVQFEFGRDARIAEKRLHRKFASSKYSGPPVMKNGNTELFTADVMEE